MGILKKLSWDSVIERIEKRLSTWKGNFLRIGKAHRNFPWNDTSENRKYHPVNWNQVCKPVDCGGLGIHPISDMNKALLGKWIWKVGDNSQGL